MASVAVVRFYGSSDPYAEFSNFYRAPFTDDEGLLWETTEHFFQAHKFKHVPSYFHLIRFADTPRKAFLMGRQDTSNERVGNQRVYDGSKYTVNAEIMRHAHFRMREEWHLVKLSIMYEALIYKFTQHQDLKNLLLSTGDAKIEEDSPYDSYWGTGADGKGHNWLGHLLMVLRNELKEGNRTPKLV